MEITDKKIMAEEIVSSIENTPEEVRRFIWSDAFKKIIQAIGTKFEMNQIQQSTLSDIAFDLITNHINEKDCRKKLSDQGVPLEKQDELFDYLYDYVIEPSLNESSNNLESEDIYTDISNLNSTENLSTSKTLENIQERLKTPKPIAPAMRSTQNQSQLNNKPKKIDPYHEPIED